MRAMLFAAAAIAVALAGGLSAQAPVASPRPPQSATTPAGIVCPSAVADVALLARPGGDALLAAAPCGVGVLVVASTGAWVQVTLPGVGTGWVERKYLGPPPAPTVAVPPGFTTGLILGVSQKVAAASAPAGKAYFSTLHLATIAVPALARQYTVQCIGQTTWQRMTNSFICPDLDVGAAYPVRVKGQSLWLMPGGPRLSANPSATFQYAVVAVRLATAERR
ncbi:MAG: hypothetical protein ACRD2E_05250 [Terriglobales bacterium]